MNNDPARDLAEKWQLEYREAHAVSVDPRALSLLDGADCRRLRAVPLSAVAGVPLVAVAAPSEERFAAVRELTGERTRFVLIAERTLDGLLSSRIFAGRDAAAPAAPAPVARPPAPAAPEREIELLPLTPPPAPPAAIRAEPEPAPPAAEPTPEPLRFAQPPEPQLVAVDDALVEAVAAALERRLGSSAPATAAPDPRVDELLARIDSRLEAWSTMADGLSDDPEDSRRSLRETKEQLSVAHAELDQQRLRIRALETEVAESRALLADARLRLREAADALETGTTRLEESHDLL